jgi:hypothetical protein
LRAGVGEHLGEARRDRGAFAGKRDGRLEQIGPRQFAVFVMGELERGEHTGNAHGKAARHGGITRKGLSVRPKEKLGRCCRWRGFPSVEACELFRRLIPIKDEGAAADPRRLRLDDVEHHLSRDAGIDCAAAFTQNRESCLCGE